MSDRTTGEQTGADSEVPSARGQAAYEDRRQRIEALRAKKKRSERLRSTAFMLVIVIGTAAFFAKPAYNWVDKKFNDPLKRSIASFGVPLGDAGCGKVTQDKASGTQDHVQVGIRVAYEFIPPSSGKHYSNPVAFAATPFFTTKDYPPVENTVHNMEHGYTILWYDPKLTGHDLDEIKKLALRLRDDATYQQFIATPWDPTYGAFPADKYIALTHWSAPDPKTGVGFGHRLFCERLSGQGVQDFMDKYPATDAPERNIR
ncbi:MAG TPA: DUF3105 domain-containing protein [Sporichthya sp.]|nr:DUF3105 domain-containing protein [Sporichthya sp.]